MNEIIKKLVIERHELSLKCEKAAKFLFVNTDHRNRVCSNEQYSMIKEQLEYMNEYLEVLTKRIFNLLEEEHVKPQMVGVINEK